MSGERRGVRTGLLFAAVVATVAALRLACWADLERSPLAAWHLWTETDDHHYVEWSRWLADGRWLDVPPYRPLLAWQNDFGSREEWDARSVRGAYFHRPLYGTGLALLRRAAGDPVLPARGLQLLLASLTAGAVALAVARLAAPHAPPGTAAAIAAAAGLLYGTYAPLVFQDGALEPDGPAAHLATLLVVLPLASDGARARRAGVVGLLGGSAVLLRQTLLPLALVAGAVQAVRARRPRRAVLALAAGLALPLLALAARNARAGAPLTATDMRGAYTLAWAHAPRSAAGVVFGNPFRFVDAAGGRPLKTAILVLHGWRERPLDLLAFELQKLVGALGRWELPDNASFDFFRQRLGTLRPLPVLACLLGPGLAGLAFARRRGLVRGAEAALLLAGLLVPLLTCVLAAPLGRYRVALAGPLAVGVALWLLLLSRSRGAERVALLCGGLALSALHFLPGGPPAPGHRFSDALAAATLAERFVSPGAGAAEIVRYVREGGDDPQRDIGLLCARRWWEGDRAVARVAPEGVAPPSGRFVAPRQR